MKILRSIVPLATAILAAAPATHAAAQTNSETNAYPNQAVHIIVPFPPGGPLDLMTRIVAQKLNDDWKQPVVIDNRVGANSAIGASAAARSRPDGYTLLVAMDTTLVYNPITTSQLGYDPKSFATISLMTKNTPLLITTGNGPKTVKELLAQVKAAPEKFNYGAALLPARLAGYLFKSLGNVESTEVNFRGSADIVQGLLNGGIQYSFDGLAASLALIQDGRLRPLAKLAERPLTPLPNLAHISDDLPGFGDIAIWSGLAAPNGTPSDIIAKIQKSVATALADPAVITRLDSMGISAVSSTPEEFQKFVDVESARWSKVIKESGLKFE